MIANVCRDVGRPGCLTVIDPRFTMDFSNIGEQPIYWCSHCGAEAQAIDKSITEAFETRPGFYEEFKKAIEDAESQG